MINQPLYGRRIVITRPEAKPLAEELERLGAEVTIVPLIEIHPAEGRGLEEAVESLSSYDWIVLTSVNGVAAVASGLSALAGPTRVAAVGPVTADAIRELRRRAGVRGSGRSFGNFGIKDTRLVLS